MTERWFEDMDKRFEKVERVLDLLDEAKLDVAIMVAAEKHREQDLEVADYRNDEVVFLLQ